MKDIEGCDGVREGLETTRGRVWVFAFGWSVMVIRGAEVEVTYDAQGLRKDLS